MEVLDKVNNPDDLKALDIQLLPELCGDLRDLIINTVSKTGGHLSSNLGVVELTVAIHRVYDTSKDRLVFDVGHQSYVHKILTGRKERMDTLRQLDGLSGFPKPSESEHDAFIGGHASNSISVALGMARARTLKGEDYDVAALIGDGAMTGGLAYEGLSNAGASREPMVVILNDNGMSIQKNVGGFASFLSRKRTSPGYISFKRNYTRALDGHPKLHKFFSGIKNRAKRFFLPTNMFDDLGMYYLGPVDGTDVLAMETALKWAREMKRPVLLHVVTQKGIGYSIAEENPEVFHGVGPFNPVTGELKESGGTTFSKSFGEKMVELGKKDESIVAITAAMGDATGLGEFSKEFPKRFFDTGITEGNSVSMAAGMAKRGLTPIVAVYSSFMQRGYDMLLHDVAIQKLHVVFAIDRAGLVGRDGETHQGVFDISYMTTVPNMAVFCPSTADELKDMLELAVYKVKGPAAVRYPRGAQGKFDKNTSKFFSVKILEGADVTIVTYGIMINEAVKAAVILKERGCNPEIIKLNLINPLDAGRILESLSKTRRLIVVEDVCNAGCVGQQIINAAVSAGIFLYDVKLLNLGGGLVRHGSVQELYYLTGIDAQSIAKAALSMLYTDVPEIEEAPPKQTLQPEPPAAGAQKPPSDAQAGDSTGAE